MTRGGQGRQERLGLCNRSRFTQECYKDTSLCQWDTCELAQHCTEAYSLTITESEMSAGITCAQDMNLN